MNQLLSIVDDKLVIDKLRVRFTEGSLTHAGSLEVIGTSQFNDNVNIARNINISGSITADTIHVKHIITEESVGVSDQFAFTANTDQELNGKGFSWTWGQGSTQLIYRTGNRLWASGSVDISAGNTYRIGNVPVITEQRLGVTITESNLTSVGTLEELRVSGDAILGDFAVFNSTFNRLGIGNEEPNAAIDILENNVNIIIGSPSTNLATIGTYSNHDVGIITDNITRILIKQNGDIQIGDPIGKNGVVRINGSLHVDNLVSDTRIDRTSPLQFRATADTSIYGLGLTWNGTENTRQLIMASGPDRIYSTESIDLGAEKMFYIDRQPVLSSGVLGSSVIHSNLITVGSLERLTVIGETVLLGGLDASNSIVKVKSLVINSGDNLITIEDTGISSNNSVAITSQESVILSGDKNSIEIGSKTNNRKPVKVFGPLSVGINNPDPTVNFSVGGDVSIGNKRFTNSTSAPTIGSYEMGDICWNSNPIEANYIGWVCVVAGNPGQWLPFGEIKSQ